MVNIFIFFAAGIFILQGAEFLAMLLVIVYVGAVATLFLFVIMMLNIDYQAMKKDWLKILPFCIIFLLVLLLISIWQLQILEYYSLS